jgi:hypothetical protein
VLFTTQDFGPRVFSDASKNSFHIVEVSHIDIPSAEYASFKGDGK